MTLLLQKPGHLLIVKKNTQPFAFKSIPSLALQAGIEFKKNLRVRFGNYGGLKLEYFWVVKSKKAKSFIRG